MKSGWPDFLLIGAPKAGTTALYRALSRHSEIFLSAEKEPRYFAYMNTTPNFNGPAGTRIENSIVRLEKDYLQLFQACPEGCVAGEASSAYLYSAEAPANAWSTIPNLRIVAVLRHPVDRAYSQWLQMTQEGLETESFEVGWKLEEQRRDANYPPLWFYRDRGFYGRDLSNWLQYFPREQVLVLFYEDWLTHPQETLYRVYQHLGVGVNKINKVTREHVSSQQPRWAWLHHRMVEDNKLRQWAQSNLPLFVRDAITLPVKKLNLRAGPALNPTVRARLTSVYLDDIVLLEKLTGRNLEHWKTGGSS